MMVIWCGLGGMVFVDSRLLLGGMFIVGGLGGVNSGRLWVSCLYSVL